MKERITIKKLCSMIVFMLFYCAAPTQAQNVHIGLDNGSLMYGQNDGIDTGWGNGFSSLWRHEQLALSMAGSDRDGVTNSGEIGFPSSVFGSHNGKLTIVGGRRPSFIVVSLPKGYRITRYRIVLTNDLTTGIYGSDWNNNMNTNNGGASSNGYGTMRFYETEQWDTDGTNSGTNPRPDDESNSNGYNTTRVRYIEPGTDWQNGQIGSVVINQAENNGSPDIKTNDKGKDFIIERTGTQDNQGKWDMGNQLYFRLVKDYYFYGITIKEFKVWFTAEGTFEEVIEPHVIGPATSMTTTPFYTNKTDLGIMDENDGIFSYRKSNVSDYIGLNYLYQDDAVENGVPADVANNKNIYPVEVDGVKRFALKSDTYFIETPMEIVSELSGNSAPIGYRIVGATFKPLWGTPTYGQTIEGGTYDYITYTSGGTTYYLNKDGRFIKNKTISWVADNNGVHSGDIYLTYSSSNNTYSLTTGNSNTNQKVYKNDNGLYIRIRQQGQNYNYYYLKGTTKSGEAPKLILANEIENEDRAQWTEEIVQDATSPSYTPGPYKLRIWKCDGSGYILTDNQEDNTCFEISDINDPDLNQVIDMGLCNNDAIKFEIETIGENAANTQALVEITLVLQALNPYIDKMNIVCHDETDVLQMVQEFSADDFSVSGGKFIFYVPEDYGDKDLTFTFANLYSKYGDETYYDHVGRGASRYSFVTSDYFDKFDGKGDGGLYDPAYPSAETNYDYTTKISTSTAGTVRFKFNNAENLGDDANSEKGYLEEYPFSVSEYLSGHYLDPDAEDPATAETASYTPCVLNASIETQKSDIYFVFTADETRYNIAPTHAWQHRFYAFYRMEIEVQARTFKPEFTWTKIYDKTFQLYKEPKRDENDNIVKDDKGNVVYEEEGTEIEDSMWGLTLDVAPVPVLDENNNPVYENGEPVYKKVQGYLTYQEIINNIEGRGEPGQVGYIPSRLDPNNVNGPASIKQILYIDGTPLYSVINSAEDQKIITLQDLQDILGRNTLVFVPENAKPTNNNVAYKDGDSFTAGGNIVLTDKLPFYSPYDIKVDAANYATYSRTIPNTSDAIKNVTVMLPFTIRVDEGTGLHTNQENSPGSGKSFTVNTMLGESNMSLENGSGVNYGNAYFQPITGTFTMPNTPYMIKIDNSSNQNSDEDLTFIVTQKGSSIVKTPALPSDFSDVPTELKDDEDVVNEPDYNTQVAVCTGRLIKGADTQGTFGGKTYTFTNYASYSGNKYDRAVTENVFYFGNTNNKYVDLHTLSAKYRYLYVYPFRGVYYYSTSGESESGAKFMKYMNICYGENPTQQSETTAIKDMPKWADLMLRTGKRTIILTATKDQTVSIYGMNGVKTRQIEMNAGESQVVTVPSGVYVVNGTKIVVR